MSQNIDGKVVVITGASSGLGDAASRYLAANGARLMLGARRGARLDALASGIREEGGQAAFRVTDVTDSAQVDALVQGALEIFGRVDVMINNAGLMPHSPLERRKIEDWDV